MPKGQRSNKEAKKPKKDKAPAKPLAPASQSPTPTTVVASRQKKQ